MSRSNRLPSPSPAPIAGRYPVRIPVRMTQEERARIGQHATALSRSISRYLVELATRSKPPLALQDKARLKFLHALFTGATDKVTVALASSRFVESHEEEVVHARVCLQEVLRLLEAIGQEMGRRLE